MKASRCCRRWLVIVGVLFVLYSVVGFFVLPPIVRGQLEKRLSAELGRPVHLAKVRVNPYTLSVTLESFMIEEKGRSDGFVGWKRLYVNFDALSSIFGSWVLRDIELEGFHGAVVINPDGSFNFADILAKLSARPSPAASKDSATRPVRIARLAVTEARMNFSDQSTPEPFATTMGPVTFTLTEFRTAGARGAPYHFDAVTEAGEKLSWTGTLAMDPIASSGAFEIGNIILKKYSPYFANRVNADIADGKLSFSGHYEARSAGPDRTLKLSDTTVRVRDLKLLERGNGQTAVELPTFDLTGLQADAITQKASIAQIALSGGRITVRREKDGMINLLAMIQPPADVKPVSPGGAGAALTPSGVVPAAPVLPDVRLSEFVIKGLAVEITDLTGPRAAQLAIGDLNVSVKDITLIEPAPMPFAVSMNWSPKGTVKLSGKALLKPEISADLAVEVTALELLPISPYLEQFINAHLVRGSVSTTSQVQLTMRQGVPVVSITGNIRADNLGLIDSAQKQDLAGFTSFAISDLKAATSPSSTVSIGEIAITAPYARVVVNPDGSINLKTLARTAGIDSVPAATPASASQPSAAAANPPPQITINRVVIQEGEFTFTDSSLQPSVHMALSQFEGTVSGLSSENLARGDVNLKGSVDGVGPVAIVGKIDPLSARKFVDLKIDFRNVDLLPTSPYTGKFAGYALSRGKLQVDSAIHLDGSQLATKNVVTLHQFTFGNPTNSPDATKLPVRLGVALLKDLEGKIVIDLPVEGSLDDPSFRVGKVVVRVLLNLLTKAAVSPFSLIGSMFGGGGDDLAFQEFVPGEAEMQPSEQKKLETMVKAMTNRPGLSVGVEGCYDTDADAYALKLKKFAASVRRQIWEERHALSATTPPPDELEITPEQHAAMVKKLFDSRFPPGSELGTPLPPPPEVIAPPAPPKAGFFSQLLDMLSFKARRERMAAERENQRRQADYRKATAAAAEVGLPLQEMTGRLAQLMVVGDDELRELAAARANRVRNYFIQVGAISPDRVFLSASNSPTAENKGPRVFLTLQ